MKSTELLAEDQGPTDGPTRTSHLFEQFHEILWRKILDGEIQPRQRLKDTEWALKLGVSRTPVREAMRKMQQEGILLPLTQGGCEVRSGSLEDFLGLYQCRAALDGLAAQAATQRFTKKAESDFKRLLDKGDKAIEREDLDEAFLLNAAFHDNMIELSGNAHLIGLSQSIKKLILFYRSTLQNQGKAEPQSKEDYLVSLKETQDSHRAILAAMAAGDAEDARRLMETHLLEGANQIASRIIK